MSRKALIEHLTGFFRNMDPDVVAAYLFGSYARDEAGPNSDLDIAVLFHQAPERTLMNPSVTLKGNLERQLCIPVDLIVMNSAPVDLIHRVLRDGILLSGRDAPERISFEVKARNDYFDLLPYLHRYREEQAA